MERSWYKSGPALLAEIEATRPAADEVAVWYLGQCGFVYKSAAVTVYIDAVLNDLCDEAGVSRRRYPPPFDPADVRADLLPVHARPF